MENTDSQILAERLERVAEQAVGGLERQMAEEEADARRAKELMSLLKEALVLARELRGQEAREVTVRFIGATAEASE